MRIIANLTKSIKKGMNTEYRILTRGIRFGTKEAGAALKNSLRKQVRNAGMTRNFSRTWQDRFYSNDGFDPAVLVFSKAPEIIHSFNEGLIIRAKNKEWLVIRTKNAPKKLGRFRTTPKRLTQMRKDKLRFVQKDKNTAFLIAKNPKGKSVIMFVLVKRVKLPKKFDVERSARKWAGKTPELIERELAKQIARAER